MQSQLTMHVGSGKGGAATNFSVHYHVLKKSSYKNELEQVKVSRSGQADEGSVWGNPLLIS